MKLTRLNLATLRKNVLPRPRRIPHIEDAIVGQRGISLSRRQMLALTGTTAISASPAIKTIGTTLAGTFEIVGDHRRLAFMIGGKERWAIDTRRFAGSPKLSIDRSGRMIRVELRDARYPGTDLPADLTCEIRPGILRRSMDLRLALGGFACRMPLEAWLLGAQPAGSMISLDGGECVVGPSTRLLLSGRSHAEFAPDWSFSFDGRAGARLAGVGADLMADTFQLALADADTPSLFDQTASRRTLFWLDRGKHSWSLLPREGDFGGWSFHAGGDTFDRIHLELSESRSGRRRGGMVAEGDRDMARLSARPHGALLDERGTPFGIPLRGARYAVAYDGDRSHAALFANYGRQPQWMHAGGVSVLLGDDDEERRFELVGRDGSLERQRAAPAMLATFLPLDGAIARPATTPKGTRLAILDAVGAATAGEREGNYLKLNPLDLDEPPAMVLSSAAAALVRPEDLVVLIFQFDGMMVKAGPGGTGSPGGTPVIERTGGAANIIVWLQPQNISEQAFFETDPSYPVSKGKPGDPDAANEASAVNPKPYVPPVNARMAGLSRLSFKVPSSVSSIQCTLEELLKYCGQFEMNVAPHALPPKAANWYPLVVTNDLALNKYTGNSFLRQLDLGKARGGTKLGSGSAGRSGSDLKVIDAESLSRVAPKQLTKAEELIVTSRANTQSKLQNARYTATLSPSKSELEKAISGFYLTQINEHPKLRAPLPTETSIEAPYRLYVSPNKYGAWAHSPTPVVGVRTGRTELWHTRLGVRDQGEDGLPVVDEHDVNYRTIRAIWSPDINPSAVQQVPDHANKPFRMTLDAFDRVNIVNLSSNFNIEGSGAYLLAGVSKSRYEPAPIAVERMMLSSMGAWMDVRGVWPSDTLPNGFSVEEWKHRGTMGRDHYVKVVYAGFLFPFGHHASVVKVSERKFQPHPGNPTAKVAYVRQRMYIVVREPEKAFRVSNKVMKDMMSGTPGINVDLQMPFQKVRITTTVTPNLDPPEDSDLMNKSQGAFWPRVANEDFQFHMVMEDIAGNNVELTMPLLFIGKEENDRSPRESSILPAVGNSYETMGTVERKRRPINGQQVAYTESTKPGDTQFETVAITFGVQVPDKPVFDAISVKQPRFYPVMRSADVMIPAAKHLVGNNAPTSVRYAPVFLTDGFAGDNRGEVFFQMLPGRELNLDFNKNGDKSGGLVKPNMKISALSRLAGPIAGDNAVEKFGVDGKFNPKDFFGSFGGVSAKLFGVIDIWELIDEIGLDNLDLVPKFVTEALDVIEGFMQDIQIFLGYVEEVKKIGGAIASTVENLRADINNILGSTGNLPALPGHINSFISHLNALPAGYIALPKAADMQDAVRREAEKKLNQFRELADSGQGFIGAVENFINAVEMAKEMKVKFEWRPAIHDWGFPGEPPLFIASNQGKDASFVIAVEMRAKTDGSTTPSLNILCSLENFTLDMVAPASFIKLYFSKLQFMAVPGKKMDINVELAKLEFVGVLSFVEALRSLIPLDGFSDPPALDISMEGIKASFSIALPNIAFGVFSLQNLSLGAGFTLPFIGDPLSVNFNFCTRENPFLLTVSAIGGGGYFGLVIDPGGVQMLEAAFEFGASLALDFGVASGEVHIMGGIYFKMTAKEATLSGYLRIGGSVDVLGLITASIELKMELIYEFNSGKCIGRATLTIEVEVLFFSASVEISCERKFAGSNGDPSFEQLMEPQGSYKPWDEYCEAFA